MSSRVESNPAWVDAILGWRWTWFGARVALVSAFLIGGIIKLSDVPSAIAEQEHFGLYPGWLWASLAIVVELGGSMLILFDRLVWLGAGGLGVLTAIAIFAAERFWTMNGHERFIAMNGFFEHLGLIGGFVMVALIAARQGRARKADR